MESVICLAVVNEPHDQLITCTYWYYSTWRRFVCLSFIQSVALNDDWIVIGRRLEPFCAGRCRSPVFGSVACITNHQFVDNWIHPVVELNKLTLVISSFLLGNGICSLQEVAYSSSYVPVFIWKNITKLWISLFVSWCMQSFAINHSSYGTWL